MTTRPTELALSDSGELLVDWSDGQRRSYRVQELRDNCPCATCREKRQAVTTDSNLLPVLSLEETQPLRIGGMKPVGSYAYSISFSDGHDTGIYTLDVLRSLGTVVD